MVAGDLGHVSPTRTWRNLRNFLLYRLLNQAAASVGAGFCACSSGARRLAGCGTWAYFGDVTGRFVLDVAAGFRSHSRSASTATD